MRAGIRTAIWIFFATSLLSSGPGVLRAQAPTLDSVLVAGVGHAVRIWRADDRSRAPVEGKPQFVHDSSVAILLPDDQLMPVPLRQIVRVSELERAKPANQLYFKFGGVIVGAVAGAIVGNNIDKSGSIPGSEGPKYGSTLGAIGGAFLGGIIGSALGSLSHPREHWVTVYRR